MINPSDLRPNELAAIIFGVIGMILGGASYKRAKRSEAIANEGNERGKRAEERAALTEERSRDLAFAQRKLDALNLLNDGESALSAGRRRMISLADRALEAGATDVIEPAEDFARQYQNRLSALDEKRGEVNGLSSAGRSHDELLRMTESYVAEIKRIYDPKLLEAEDGSFIDQAERNIRIMSIQIEVEKQLHAGTTAGDA